MQSKSLLIAIAAFAVTTTGVNAYGGSKILTRAGLTEDQVEAFEEARELRESGNRDKARDILMDAGIDEKTLRSIHESVHEARDEKRDKIHKALEDNDYSAFLESVSDSPLSDIITSEEDFTLFREAHQLKEEGELFEAKEIFDELGLEGWFGRKGEVGHERAFSKGKAWSQLTEEQQEALKVAREANDKDSVQAIMEEAGVDFPPRKNKL